MLAHKQRQNTTATRAQLKYSRVVRLHQHC